MQLRPLLLTLAKLFTQLCNGDLAALELANEYVLEASAPDFVKFSQLSWGYLTVLQSHGLEIELKLLLFLARVRHGWSARLVLVNMLRTE